ncbi:S-layer homology domain-containing protein [Pseudoflavonifractor phocaeensis]|uniref:S-layer homology domain-containing protein n=1 Tax=Pseudoflavonifractor phocaeensis TaxID=1870988 RepID=UPI0019585482|nr:S-layer homology domain-containing protein [Pseudoflavonifractor phocaeensis]MBM6927180.1 S-layer homology domain-containing protein [Pseudoflavonifractor phocaeensis]
MRNLKRVLSLALAAMMLMGMMVVGASAAGAKDFTDYDEVENKEAVSAMTTLNVFNGKEDGSYFAPSDTLTREEMSKIITYVMNGGAEPALGTKPVPSYSDIDGNWAEKYIEYCTSAGIIAGDGTGKFNPKDTLTYEQFAKTLLTGMGYKAEVFGFVGNSWAVNVNRYANEAGLYKGLEGVTPSDPISRDDACQMAYNAIQAPLMIRSWNQSQTTGEVVEVYELAVGDNGVTTNSLFKDKFDGTIYEGVLTASGEYGIGGATGEDSLSIAVEKIDNGTVNDENGNAINMEFTWKDMDLTDMVGLRVKMLYNHDTEEIYGVYTMDEYNTVIETTSDKVVIDGTKISVDGVKYSYDDANGTVFEDGTNAGPIDGYFPAKNDNLTTANTVYLISNDKDQKIDLALVETVAVAEVNYVGTETFSVTLTGGSRQQGFDGLDTLTALNQELEDVVVKGDMFAKGDIVLVTEDYYTASDAFEVIEPQTVTITGVNKGKYMIDDTWYQDDDNITAKYALNNNGINSGDTVEMVAIGGINYYAKKVSGTNNYDTLAFVYQAGKNATDYEIAGNTNMANLIFADGSKKSVKTVDREGNSVDVSGKYGGTNLVGHIVTFEVTAGGDYILTALDNDSNKAGFTQVIGDGTDGNVAVASGSSSNRISKVGGYDLADDAVVFVMKYATTDMNTANVANNAKVISGKEAKTLLAADYNKSTHVLTSKVDGFEYAQVVTLAYKNANEDLPGGFDGATYGYLVDDAVRVYDTDASAYYRVFKVWDGSEVVTLKEKTNAEVTFMTKGNVIVYDESGDGIIKNVERVNAITTQVTGINSANDRIGLVGTAVTEINSDTQILYVDSQNFKGYAEGVIREADDTYVIGAGEAGVINGNDQANVRYVLNKTGDAIAFLLVDVNNKMANVAEIVDNTISADDLQDLLNNGKDVQINGNYHIGTVTVPAGANLAVNGVLTLNANLTVDGNLNVTDLVLNGKTVDGDGVVTVSGTLYMGSKITGNVTINAQKAVLMDDMTISGGNVTIKTNVTNPGSNTLTITGGTLTVLGEVKAPMEISGAAEVTTGDVTGNITVQATGTDGEATTAEITTGDVTGSVTVEKGATADVTTGDVSGDVTNKSTGSSVTTGDVTGNKTGDVVGNKADNGTVEAAKIADTRTVGKLTQPFGKNEVSATYGVKADGVTTSYDVVLTITDLVKHQNGAKTMGYWGGISVEAVEGDSYSFGWGSYNASAQFTKITADTLKGEEEGYCTFYRDFGSADNKGAFYVAIKDANGAVTVYNVDCARVTLKTTEDLLKASLAKKWEDDYKYNVTPTISGNTVTYSGTHEQFAEKVDGKGGQIFATSADMARLLGGLYRTDSGATVTAITYEGTTYKWKADGGLTGSNWQDSQDETLVKALAADIKADFRDSDDNVKTGAITASYDLTINGDTVTLTFVKAAAPAVNA